MINNKFTLFALTWPIFLEMLLHMLILNVDTLMLSNYSDDAVASVGVASQIIFLSNTLYGVTATGISIILAQYLGAKLHKNISEIIVVGISLNVIIGLIISSIIFYFGLFFLKAMGIQEMLIEGSLTYLKIVGGLSFIEALLLTFSSISRTYGFTKYVMYVSIGINITNIIGNYLVLYGTFNFPVLGIKGVAWSTVISRLIGLIIIFVFFKFKIPEKLFFQNFYKFLKQHFGNIMKVSLPSMGENLSSNMAQLLITSFLAIIGREAITARIYTYNLISLIVIFSGAISSGTQIIIGHMIGARNNNEAYKQCFNSIKVAVMMVFCASIIFTILSENLLSLFTNNQSVIYLAAKLLLLSIILEPLRAVNMIIINSLRATGDTRIPVYIVIISNWGVSVTLAYIIGIYFDYGLVGIYVGFILDELIKGIFILRRWQSRKWEKMILIEETTTYNIQETSSS